MQQSKSLKRCWLRQGCDDINNYHKLNKIHQGNYGVVYRALEIPTQEIYAIKKLKLAQGEDFPITSLREIVILRQLQHPNIISITRVAGSLQRDKVYIVMEYIDHQLKQLLRQVKFRQSEVRRLMRDLLEAIAYLHERKIIHRDLKTSNLLYSNSGILKICDFGLARKASQALMTQQVITMWYRPPELFLGEYNYSTELDIWSAGCIMGEIILREPLFQGKTQLQQLDLIFKSVGSPVEQIWPQIKKMKNYIYIQGSKNSPGKLRQLISEDEYGLNSEGIDLLQMMINPHPMLRISAKKALLHPWFKQQICARAQMPQHAPLNEADRMTKKIKRINNDG